MRICHVITRLIIGGAQENTLLTCRGLVERGHDVLLLAGPETGPEGSLWDKVREWGIESRQVDSLRRAISPWKDWRAVGALRDIYRQWGCDVVHTHSSKAGIVGRMAARRARVPAIVHTIHGMSFNRTQPALVQWLYAMLERRVARYTDMIVSVADAMTRQSLAAGVGSVDKYSTVYSGMEVDRFRPSAETRRRVRADWKVDDDTVVVGTVARLFRNKGYERILQALPGISKACPQVRLVWVGDGRDRQNYEDELRSLHLEDRVIRTGLVRPERIAELINGFDLLLHASEWEGLARCLPQALLCEVPVVTFDTDGAPEVVQAGVTGELVPHGDVAALVEAVVRLVQSPELRREYGQRGREHCRERFDYRFMVGMLEALYERVPRVHA